MLLLSNKIFLEPVKHVRKSLKTARTKDSITTNLFFDHLINEVSLLKGLCSKGFGRMVAGMPVQQGFQRVNMKLTMFTNRSLIFHNY
jgi:hypothetical protein